MYVDSVYLLYMFNNTDYKRKWTELNTFDKKKMLQKFLTIKVPLHTRSANNMFICTKPYEMSDFLTRLNKDSQIEIQYTWLTVFYLWYVCNTWISWVALHILIHIPLSFFYNKADCPLPDKAQINFNDLLKQKMLKNEGR